MFLDHDLSTLVIFFKLVRSCKNGIKINHSGQFSFIVQYLGTLHSS